MIFDKLIALLPNLDNVEVQNNPELISVWLNLKLK